MFLLSLENLSERRTLSLQTSHADIVAVKIARVSYSSEMDALALSQENRKITN